MLLYIHMIVLVLLARANVTRESVASLPMRHITSDMSVHFITNSSTTILRNSKQALQLHVSCPVVWTIATHLSLRQGFGILVNKIWGERFLSLSMFR